MSRTFKEHQKFTQWWLWLILLGSLALVAYITLNELLFNQSVGNSETSPRWILVLALVFMLILTLYFWLVKLETKISRESINIRFAPFVNKTIKWNNIQTCEVLDYGFVGGWGIRLWTSYGTVYNVKGSKGLFITLKDGKRLLVGTQRNEELQQVVNSILELNKN